MAGDRWPLGRYNRWLLVVLLLSFFALWLPNLGYFSLTSDEASTAIMADMPNGGLQRQNQDSPHGPVHNLLMRAWRLAGGGQNEFLIRYPSLLLGLLLLSLVYRAGLDLHLGQLGSVAAVVLVGFNAQIIVHLREARPYALMLVTAALAVVVALRFERQRAIRGVAVLTSLLALLSHYFNIPFIAALGVWGVLAYRGRTRRDWLLSQAVAWLALAVWLPLMGRAFFNPTSLSTGKTWSQILAPWVTLPQLAMVAAVGYREAVGSWLAPVGAVLLAALWLAGVVSGRGRQRWFALVMVALPLGSYALLVWIRPVYHPKYVLPWALFATLGGGLLIARRPRLGAVLAAGMLAIMIGPTLRTLQQPYDPGAFGTADLSTNAEALSHDVLRLADSNDVFGMGTPDPVHCYYFQHFFDQHLDCALIPKAPTQTEAQLETQLGDLLATHNVLWYLDFYNANWDPHHIADAALRQQALALPLGDEEVAGRSLRLFVSPARVTRAAISVGAKFGGAAELQGVWDARGNLLHVVLVWRSLLDQPALNAKVFVHLVDSEGQVIAQHDGFPANDSRPLNTWTAGDVILDPHVVPLPAGTDLRTVSLEIGLYDPDTARRLTAVGPDGRPLADEAVSITLASGTQIAGQAP